MATPDELRRAVANLTRLADRDLAALFRQVGGARSQELRDALMDILPALVDTYGSAAATVAADWYDELRDEAGATGRFTAIPAAVPDAGASSLIGWAMGKSADDSTFQTLIAGGLQRRIANASRQTVAGSSYTDRQSVGWKRIGAGACEFCRMLIERDSTYSEATADFGSHDHCNCQAYPLIKGAEPIDVKDYLQSPKNAQRPGESVEDYERRRAPERARVRDWIDSH